MLRGEGEKGRREALPLTPLLDSIFVIGSRVSSVLHPVWQGISSVVYFVSDDRIECIHSLTCGVGGRWGREESALALGLMGTSYRTRASPVFRHV